MIRTLQNNPRPNLSHTYDFWKHFWVLGTPLSGIPAGMPRHSRHSCSIPGIPAAFPAFLWHSHSIPAAFPCRGIPTGMPQHSCGIPAVFPGHSRGIFLNAAAFPGPRHSRGIPAAFPAAFLQECCGIFTGMPRERNKVFTILFTVLVTISFYSE